ncbi:dnaJsubfamily C member 21-like [Dorcoceras hygrometricum]|uniref:DnaJsubfamily C member 21-like n=1 Tax=Dorcoceras hygrometricum TaxID=472368 RepID=A0A2Z7A223_9LAMI|nr:dnaJsubfamily C member 21-like [Dorcoceras hygrometricum]
MGNTDPNKTKAGNKYEVKPQYEELSKQINMQHVINQCYECMRAAKEISQLGQCINRQNISGRLYTTVNQPGNHRSVIIGARQPITAQRFLNRARQSHGLWKQISPVFAIHGTMLSVKSVTGSRSLQNNQRLVPAATSKTQRFNLIKRRRRAYKNKSSRCTYKTNRCTRKTLAAGYHGERLAYRLIELVNYINRGGADKKGESSSRGPQQPSDVQIRDSAVSGSAGRTPTFAQSVEIAQRRSRDWSTRSVLGKCVYLVTLVMSLFDLQDVHISIGSIATLDLPMVVDLIGIYGLKGPYCTLTTTNWFLQVLSVIPKGSWDDVARRSYHDPMGKSGIVIPEPQWLWAHG